MTDRDVQIDITPRGRKARTLRLGGWVDEAIPILAAKLEVPEHRLLVALTIAGLMHTGLFDGATEDEWRRLAGAVGRADPEAETIANWTLHGVRLRKDYPANQPAVPGLTFNDFQELELRRAVSASARRADEA